MHLYKTQWVHGRHFNIFLGWAKFFLFSNATGLLKKWKKQHFICSNVTLFIVPCNWYYFMTIITIESCNRIDYISVIYAWWCQWNVWKNTCSSRLQLSIICMSQLQPSCSAAALVRNVLPKGMKAPVSPVQWSRPYSILLASTQDSNLDGRIRNHKRWPPNYYCTLISIVYWTQSKKEQVYSMTLMCKCEIECKIVVWPSDPELRLRKKTYVLRGSDGEVHVRLRSEGN